MTAMTSRRYVFGAIVAGALSASGAHASDPIIGVWETEPDRKNLTSHIEVTQCAEKFCGKVLAAFTADGQQVRTKNVGKKLFWDVAKTSGSEYGGGEFWVPLMDVVATPKMHLSGNSLSVKGCKMGVCGKQTWKRLK